MLNPYAMMYDARMDVYRWVEQEDGDIAGQHKVLLSRGRPCRYSSSGQAMAGETTPDIINSHKLFCGLEEDIQEKDHLVITLHTGKVVEVDLGECHPYTFQWQCQIKRDDKA